MMMSDDLLKLLLQTIGKEISDNDKLPEEIQDEYEDLFSKYNVRISDLIKKYTAKDAERAAIDSYLEIIFLSNPIIIEYKDKIDVRTVKSLKENTKTVNYDTNKSLVVFDTHVMKFLWVMNKALIYGANYLTVEENKKLFTEIFLYFASYIAFDEKYIFPRPVTPKYKDVSTYKVLHIYTKVQEIFLLSHEIAHNLIKDNSYCKIVNVIASHEYLLSHTISNDIYHIIEEEILADEIAFEMTLNAFNKDESEDVEIVCSAVFALMMYFLWLRISYKNYKDDEITLWLHRNNFLKTRIYAVYIWGNPIFIDNIIELMKVRMEPAAMAVSSAIESVKTN
jgi:hypothetical protein